MEIQSLKLAYFSPTGSTKAVVEGIAGGIQCGSKESIDFTRPEAREKPLRVSANDLLILGVPVYMGRVPALIMDWLKSIEADNTPVACVVVYGNRAYEDALLELSDTLAERGCIPIAGGAFIGEHSFSGARLPTAQGRPDSGDLNHADFFGRKIGQKVRSATSTAAISDVEIPGNHPYGGKTELWDVDFIAVSDACTQCGICAEGCPTGAIDPDDSAKIDIHKCITCCACIKVCPQNAKSMKEGPLMDAAIRLNKMCSTRKEPVFFI